MCDFVGVYYVIDGKKYDYAIAEIVINFLLNSVFFDSFLSCFSLFSGKIRLKPFCLFVMKMFKEVTKG